MEEQLQAEPHEAAQKGIPAHAPSDDEVDGGHELSSTPKDDSRRGSAMSKVPLAEELIQHSSAPRECRTQVQEWSARDHGRQARRGGFGMGGVMLVHLRGVMASLMT